MKPNLVLIGAGGHASSVIDILNVSEDYNIIGLVDSNFKKIKSLQGCPVLGGDEILPELKEKADYAIITVGHVGDISIRKHLFDLAQSLHFKLPVIISPYAYVSKTASIGFGTVIHHGAIVNANAKIGNNCIINSRALIEHDACIEDNCHISTGAIVNGGVIVKEGVFLGSNATTKQGVVIPENIFVKAGSVYK